MLVIDNFGIRPDCLVEQDVALAVIRGEEQSARPTSQRNTALALIGVVLRTPVELPGQCAWVAADDGVVVDQLAEVDPRLSHRDIALPGGVRHGEDRIPALAGSRVSQR